MGAVFPGAPVVSDGLPGAVLLGGSAGAIKGVLLGLLGHFAATELLALPPHCGRLGRYFSRKSSKYWVGLNRLSCQE